MFAAENRTVLSRVSSAGGKPQQVTQLDRKKNETTRRFPQLLPGGREFLYTASPDNNSYQDAVVAVQNVTTGLRKTLVENAYFGRYLPSGHLMWEHDGTMFVAPIDLKKLELTGSPAPVLEDVTSYPNRGYAELSYTPSGTVAYLPGSPNGDQLALYWLDAAGELQAIGSPAGLYLNAIVSPEGNRVSVRVTDAGGVNLAVFDVANSRLTRLTFVKGTILTQAWAPDGKHIAFQTDSPVLTGPGIYWMRADGAGEPVRLLEGTGLELSSISPDGKRLAYAHRVPDFGIWTLPLDLGDPDHPKAGKPERFLASEFRVGNSKFSPDGRWMAYISGESSRPEVFVRPFRGPVSAPGGKWQVSTAGANGVFWPTNERELFYLGTDRRIWVTTYTATADSFAPSQPRLWSEKSPVLQFFPDPAPTGKRFLAILPKALGADQKAPNHAVFLLNFFDEVRRRTAPAH